MSDSVSNRYASAHDPLCNTYDGCGSGMECPCFVNENGCICECELIAKVRAEYDNPRCLWGWAECVPDCPSCNRTNEMLKERVAGNREGQQYMLDRCVSALNNLEIEL